MATAIHPRPASASGSASRGSHAPGANASRRPTATLNAAVASTAQGHMRGSRSQRPCARPMTTSTMAGG